MPLIFFILIYVVSSSDSVACSTIFAKTGENVTLQCECLVSGGCSEELIRWIRMNSTNALQIIDIKCGRFTTKRTNGALIDLTILQVELGDSGRYYCGEHFSSYLQFNGNGTVLMVGDAWTNNSEIHLLDEWMVQDGSTELDWNEMSNSPQSFMSEWKDKADTNSKSDWSDFPDVEHTELRCVVTGLSAPWVNIIWRSSQESWTGQTWAFTETKRGYMVESHLRIGWIVRSDREYEDEYSHNVRKKINLDRMVGLDEELWCEVQTGVNLSHHSPNFSFPQQSHPDPEWCNLLLYGEIVLCALCMCLLTLMVCHFLYFQRKGSELPSTEISPTSNSCRDVSPGITYAQLDIKRQPKTVKRQTQKNKQEHNLVYSEVRCKH